MMRTTTIAIACALAACGGGGGSNRTIEDPPAAQCGPYPDQATSPYILPYEIGTSHPMFHGNCTAPGTSHQAGGTRQHAYDFQMPIGTLLIASRGGTVSLVEQQFPDGTRDPDHNNFVIITHEDGTHGRYFHIAQNGSLVAVDQVVARGDPIALSGDSGESTEPHPNGLVEGQSYEALPYPGCDCVGR